jgi:iron complex transport system substrate-binding protein
LAVAVACLCQAAADASPKRVASTMVCADQYVLALVPARNTAGVSYLARDPSVSVFASHAAAIPTLKADAETYLMTHSDIVVGAEHGDTKTLATLERLGVGVLRVLAKNTFPELFKQLSDVAVRLGSEDVGRKLEDDARRRLARVVAGLPGAPVLVAFYHANGVSPASGTYVDEELKAAGYRSLASALGQKGWGRLDLETLVMHPPEAILAVTFSMRAQKLQNRFYQHPVFQKMRTRLDAVVVPAALTACPNWTLVEGAEYLDAVRRTGAPP